MDLIISTFRRSILSFLNGIRFIRPQVAFVFPPSHSFLQGLIYFNQVSIYSCEVSSLFSINVWIRWSLMKMLTELQVHYSSSLFFSGGLISSLGVIISLPVVSHIFPCEFLIQGSIIYSPLPVHIWSAEDISEDSCFHSLSVQVILRLLSHSSHLIQPVQSPLSINCSTVYLLVGPNPQVFFQDLTRLS